MGSDLIIVLVAYAAAIWASLRLPCGPDPRWASPLRLPGRPLRRLRHVWQLPPEARPTGRRLELIAADARRLAARAQHPARGTSRTKIVALAQAYDQVLIEACAALGVEHLLGVLPGGEERDAERVRVEGRLWLAGLRIDDPD